MDVQLPGKLTKQQSRGLKALSLAERRFEPLELAARLKFEVADQLVALGLAETGECDARYTDWGYQTGYRLTQKGWTALFQQRARGQADQIPN
jgi:hypothetical protein